VLSIRKWFWLLPIEGRLEYQCYSCKVKAVLPIWRYRHERRKNIMAVEKSMASSSLVEVIDRILDKGVVLDAWVRISLVGIELLSIETRVVLASVETYLKYAEAIGLTASAAAA